MRNSKHLRRRKKQIGSIKGKVVGNFWHLNTDEVLFTGSCINPAPRDPRKTANKHGEFDLSSFCRADANLPTWKLGSEKRRVRRKRGSAGMKACVGVCNWKDRPSSEHQFSTLELRRSRGRKDKRPSSILTLFHLPAPPEPSLFCFSSHLVPEVTEALHQPCVLPSTPPSPDFGL